MLTATEDARVQKFTGNMDDKTTNAMFALFEVTKPGKNDIASALIMVAHETGVKLSDAAISYLNPMGLVHKSGRIPKNIEKAVRRAVKEGFLILGGPDNPHLKPDPDFLEPHCA